MKAIQEKEILFHRYCSNEMDKKELIKLVKRLAADDEFRDWFTIQIEFETILSDPYLKVIN